MFKKILLSFFVFLIMMFSFVPAARAEDSASQWYNPNFSDWYAKVYGSPENEIFGERYTAAQVQWIFFSIFSFPFKILGPEVSVCILSGDIGSCIKPLLSSAQKFAPAASVAPPQGASILGMITADRPLSGITYFKNIIRKFHLIPQAEAQTTGFGFNALEPSLNLWKGSRNVAYALLILVIVVMSFMIMFRVKISPQVAISVQSALPKLALTVILITFSYAIAGFLVDLMYVVIGLVSIALHNYSPGLTTVQIFNFLTKGQPTGINAGVSVIGLFFLYACFFVFAGGVIFLAMGGAIGALLTGGIALLAVLTPGLDAFVLLIAALVITIVFVLLVYHFLRIVWMLLKAFVSIFLLTIFAPFQLLLGTLIPSAGFGAWLKSFASSLAVFIVTGVLFFLSFIFLNQAVTLSLMDFIDDPNIIGNLIFGTNAVNVFTGSSAYWPPLLSIGGGGAGTHVGLAFLFWGASLAVFSIIPKTADIIQSFIQGKPFGYGTAIGEATTGLIMPGVKGIELLSKVLPSLGKRAENVRETRGTPAAPESPGVPKGETS